MDFLENTVYAKVQSENPDERIPALYCLIQYALSSRDLAKNGFELLFGILTEALEDEALGIVVLQVQ